MHYPKIVLPLYALGVFFNAQTNAWSQPEGDDALSVSAYEESAQNNDHNAGLLQMAVVVGDQSFEPAVKRADFILPAALWPFTTPPSTPKIKFTYSGKQIDLCADRDFRFRNRSEVFQSWAANNILLDPILLKGSTYRTSSPEWESRRIPLNKVASLYNVLENYHLALMLQLDADKKRKKYGRGSGVDKKIYEHTTKLNNKTFERSKAIFFHFSEFEFTKTPLNEKTIECMGNIKSQLDLFFYLRKGHEENFEIIRRQFGGD